MIVVTVAPETSGRYDGLGTPETGRLTMTVYEINTTLSPDAVIERARSFFTSPSTSFGASVERVDDGCLRVYFDMGDMVIGATPKDGRTAVRGSASRGAHLLTRFLTTLEPSWAPKETSSRYLFQRARAVLSSTYVPSGADLDQASSPRKVLTA